MASIGTLAVSIVARTDKFAKGMKRAMSTTSKFAAVAAKSSKLVAGLGGALSAGAFTAGLARSAERIDRLAKVADKLGVTTEALGSLRFAAQQTGVGINQFDTALQRMTRRVAEAGIGAGEAKGALAELGLDASRLSQLSADRQFIRISDALNKVRGQSDKVRLAFKLFDSEGVALLNTTRLGSKGFSEMSEKFARFSGTISGPGAKAVEGMNDAISTMRSAVGATFDQITVKLAPSITRIAERTTEWLSAFNQQLTGPTQSMGTLSKAMAFVADAVELVNIGFLGLRYGITKTIAKALELFDKFQKALAAFSEKIPGLTIKTSSLITTMAEDMTREASTQWDKLQDAWLAPPASQRLKNAFEPIHEQIDKIQEKAGKGLFGMLGDAARTQGGLLGGFSFKGFAKGATTFGGPLGGLQKSVFDRLLGQATFGMLGTAGQNFGGHAGGGSRSLLSLPEAGSIESYRQRVATAAALSQGTQAARSASMRNGPQRVGEKQLSVLEKIEEHLAEQRREPKITLKAATI